MRIWDISPKCLCRKHLLGEHRELHAIWIILSQNKKGYSRHPETLRWQGKTKALFARHEALVAELIRRDYKHLSPLDKKFARGKKVQDVFLHSMRQQRKILKAKLCQCPLD
ncbi:MAG: pyrimidine dimer DNA glycosylase [Candidatus Magasanikbacteria bacterium CG10_big_fil_rev_8_21_14_0_10_36_32]|uniref:Pyrimidine dimer DNA glycosylase n=1 Tax=Candidatus Magasanikbacteria bacterium CG10_big_fil_rev_8_21_14_0_10_36_32 TaxID=1974646 RepID=A0A2M6W5E2_9BACT|nr:MAG: pyrimidine dimer DNA glycosylase [Candidatus Magasanikbacteria bacterium CG10_big_fil_rev_8_21_14_0_10_36_32]